MREFINIVEGHQTLLESTVHVISPQEALDRGYFGPVYHGTTGDLSQIVQTGFNSKYSVPTGVTRGFVGARPIGTSNGYNLEPYGFTGIAAPVHHLSFGIYFTTVKAIAKQYAGGTTKGMLTFYLDVPNLLEINFGSPNTMMRWWRENGYDMTAEATRVGDYKAWIKATGNLSRTLRQQYDAVWFKGKGIRKLLDGDQVVVFDPRRIYVVNPKLASGLEVGAKVYHTQDVSQNLYAFDKRFHNQLYVDDLRPEDFGSAGALAGKGWRGVFWATDHNGNEVPRAGLNGIGNHPKHFIPPPDMSGKIVAVRQGPNGEKWYDVKWNKGGVQHNYRAGELRPASEKP